MRPITTHRVAADPTSPGYSCSGRLIDCSATRLIVSLGLRNSVGRTCRLIDAPHGKYRAAATRKTARSPERMPAARATDATSDKRTAIQITRRLIDAPIER